MGCACKGRKSTNYVWTSAEVNPETGTYDKVVYTSLIQAKAKVMRAGGSYLPQ